MRGIPAWSVSGLRRNYRQFKHEKRRFIGESPAHQGKRDIINRHTGRGVPSRAAVIDRKSVV